MPYPSISTDTLPGVLDRPATEACQTRRDQAARLAALSTLVWLLPLPAADRVTLRQRSLTGRLLPTRAALSRALAADQRQSAAESTVTTNLRARFPARP